MRHIANPSLYSRVKIYDTMSPIDNAVNTLTTTTMIIQLETNPKCTSPISIYLAHALKYTPHASSFLRRCCPVIIRERSNGSSRRKVQPHKQSMPCPYPRVVPTRVTVTWKLTTIVCRRLLSCIRVTDGEMRRDANNDKDFSYQLDDSLLGCSK